MLSNTRGLSVIDNALFTYVHIAGDDVPSLCVVVQPYLAVVVQERPVDEVLRGRISAALVETGCRWMMAWGMDCCLWDDSVDMAALEKVGFKPIPDDEIMMTTWHETQTIEAVLEETFIFRRQSLPPLDHVVLIDLNDHAREAYFRSLLGTARLSWAGQTDMP